MHVCMIDEKTNTILSIPCEMREQLSSLKKTCTHRKSFDFHRDYSQLPSARTSPATFLFLLSSQCQRADPTRASPNSVSDTSPYRPVARQINRPVRKPLHRGSPKARRRQRLRYVVQ